VKRGPALTLTLAFALVASAAQADPPARIPAPPPPDPAAIAARDAHLEVERRAMGVLASWALASVATGALLWGTGGDDYTRGIGIQNVAWGAIDGAIAGFGYLGSRKSIGLEKPLSYWEGEEKKLRKIFLLNAGLDVLYIATGGLLMGFGKNDLLRGSGAGIALQGSFLFTFDTAMGLGAR